MKKKFIKTVRIKNKIHYTYDLKYPTIVLNSNLKRDNLRKIYPRGQYELICPHFYFKYTGPTFKTVLTRQMKIWSRCFLWSFKKMNQHYCKRKSVIPCTTWFKIVHNCLHRKYFFNNDYYKGAYNF